MQTFSRDMPELQDDTKLRATFTKGDRTITMKFMNRDNQITMPYPAMTARGLAEFFTEIADNEEVAQAGAEQYEEMQPPVIERPAGEEEEPAAPDA